MITLVRTTFALGVAVLVLGITASHAEQTASIRVLSSNAFRAVVLELTPQFESTTGHKASVRFMGTDLKPTIEAGEQFDVAISQSDVIESLSKQNKIAAGTNVAIAYTGLGLAIRAGAPKPDIGSVAAFKQTLLNARAVASSGEGRAGVVVSEIFSRLGIADQMKAKSVLFAGSGGPKTVIDGQATS
jgi:molybdate transport system substrate-binding protein